MYVEQLYVPPANAPPGAPTTIGAPPGPPVNAGRPPGIEPSEPSGSFDGRSGAGTVAADASIVTTPGVGAVLSLTILLEIDTIGRFDTRQQFCSYARLCGAVQESAGQRTGAGNRKAGNAWLKWAFSEAAVLSAQKDERIGALLQRLASKLGKAKALSALAHKLGRAFYHMLRTKRVFDVNRFVRH